MTFWTYAVANDKTKAADLMKASAKTRFWVSTTNAGWQEVDPVSVAGFAAEKKTVVFATPGERHDDTTLIVVDDEGLKDPIPPTPWCASNLPVKQMRDELRTKMRRGDEEEILVAPPAKSKS
jgi:hypothetical protein